MKELHKELTAELLSLVVGKKVTKARECNTHGRGVQIAEPNEKYPNAGWTDVISLDTLARLMKEWCKDTHSILSAVQTNGTGYAEVRNNGQEYFFEDTEFEAVLKATHWVAKEKGLI